MRSAVYAATRADHSSGVSVPPSRLRSMSGTTNITGPPPHGVFDAQRRVPADLPRPARGAGRPGAAHGGGAHRAGRQRARGPRAAAGAGALSRRARSRFHELRRPVEGGARGRRHREADRGRSEEHTSELQSLAYLVCRLLLEKKKKTKTIYEYKH